jgi:hypothetical protein
MTRWQKKKPGDPLKIPAGAWNELLDLLTGMENFQRGIILPSETIWRVRNATSTAIPRFGIVRLDSPIIEPADNLSAFQEQLTFEGQTPLPGKPFAIAMEPIAPGAIGKVIASGITVTRVSVYDPDKEAVYAEPAPNDVTALKTYRGGTLRILWREPGNTGTKWAAVAFAPLPHPLVRVKLAATLVRDSGAPVAATLLTRGADGRFMIPTDYDPITIQVADLSGLGFSGPAGAIATAELHFGVTINDLFYEVLGIVTDIRC